MSKWRRRISYYLLLLAGIMFGYAVVYHFGMVAYEREESRSFLRSLQMVVETFTTTGYGSDAGWDSPQMLVLVMVMDITGVALIFIALPVLVVPLFEEAFSVSVPTEVDEEMSDHVIICGYTPRVETLIAELESWEVDCVIIEPDRERAADLYETGHTVIHEDPESVAGFEHARIESATAVVTDASDEMDVSIVLTAKEAVENVRVISVVDEPDRSLSVLMGSYGIGIERLIHTLVEQHADADGCRWSVGDMSVAPYAVSIVPLDYSGQMKTVADRLYGSVVRRRRCCSTIPIERSVNGSPRVISSAFPGKSSSETTSNGRGRWRSKPEMEKRSRSNQEPFRSGAVGSDRTAPTTQPRQQRRSDQLTPTHVGSATPVQGPRVAHPR